MKIEFHHVLPVPLDDTPLGENTCWKKNFFINTNEFHIAEAASGTGKTTLLSIIYGTRNDIHGHVSFDGENINAYSPHKWSQLRQRKFSMVFQELCLFPDLTMMENIQLKNSITHAISHDQIGEYADQLGIKEHLHRKCGKMSLGQQQRVAIIRALAQPFEFLLLDEPFSHLDRENTLKAAALIKNACLKNNAGLLITSLGGNDFFEYDVRINL